MFLCKGFSCSRSYKPEACFLSVENKCNWNRRTQYFLFVQKCVSSIGSDVGIFPLKEEVLNLFSDGSCDENVMYSSLL